MSLEIEVMEIMNQVEANTPASQMPDYRESQECD